MPGDISGVQYEAMVGEHSHAVTGVIDAGSYVVTGFRLRIIVSLCSADGWLEERPQLPGGVGEPYHISYRDFSPGLAVVAVRFRMWHAQDTAPAHKDV